MTRDDLLRLGIGRTVFYMDVPSQDQWDAAYGVGKYAPKPDETPEQKTERQNAQYLAAHGVKIMGADDWRQAVESFFSGRKIIVPKNMQRSQR